MVSVNNGHVRLRGTPVQIISEIGIAITALLADAPERIRPDVRENMNHCFYGAITDDAIEALQYDTVAYAEAVIKDAELFSMLSIMRKLQDALKAMKEQEDDE